LEWRYMKGDGDFRSDEVKKLRDEADIIVTNPPFSLFREFLAWLVEVDKKFLILGNKNAVTYKEVFPLIKENKLWAGSTSWTREIYFDVPEGFKKAALAAGKDRTIVFVGGAYMARSQSVWYTNIEHGRRHQPLSLMSEKDNIKYSKHKEVKGIGYRKYDNYDAIEVPFYDTIPGDYKGVMGVPISFLDKYCPEQFEILGITKTWFGMANKEYPEQTQVSKDGTETLVTKLNDGAVLELAEKPIGETYYRVGKKIYTQVYARVLIRFRKR